MKKIVSIVLSVIMAFSAFGISFPAFAEEMEMKRIENFSSDCVELAHEYDAGKTFETVDEKTDELDDAQFQTARLFVKSSSKIDTMGAEETVSGFQDWHILQYGSAEKAKKAYKYYVNQSEIESVEPDVAVETQLLATTEEVYVTRDEFQNDYAKKNLGTNLVLRAIKESNLKTSEIKVGVLDTGIDYNHELFKDRLFRTYFNASNGGNENDEYDDLEIGSGHGTETTSCVLSTTPDSVKVGCYKTLAEKGEDQATVTSWVASALLQAYSDGCSVINMSLRFFIHSEYFEDVLSEVKKNGTTLFVASGNDSGLIPYKQLSGLLCQNENVVSVGALDNCNRGAAFSNKGYFLDFFAPGADTAVAAPGNKYRLSSGTSYASPYAAGVFATLRSLDSTFSDEKIIDLMKYTCTDVFHAFNHDETWYGKERYGGGALDAYRAFCEMQGIQLVPDVKFSLSTGECNVGDQVTLSCAEDCEIYYTTDLTVADKENGIRYTEPITITENTVVNAIAYDKEGRRGQNKHEYYIAFEIDSEENFIIDENGRIIGYTGAIRNLEIPETINGITVTGIHMDLLGDDCQCEGMTPPKQSVTALKLPETVEYIEEDPWYGTELEFFSGPGLKELPDVAFPQCENLLYVNLPKVEKVGRYAFQDNHALRELYLPSCTEVGDSAFLYTKIYHLYLPKVKYYYDTFLDYLSTTILSCPNLEEGLLKKASTSAFADHTDFLMQLFLPKLKSISNSPIGFNTDDLYRAEFSELESMLQFPTSTANYKTECSLVLPSSLKEIDLGYQDKNNKSYTIYGTAGSYVQQWAKDNQIEFIELNQNTAVYTDVDESSNEYTETLFFDSLGFHKKYQWYGSYNNSTKNGVALDGANKELFNIHDYKSYPYYYCVCTSTDIGDGTEHKELIYSRVCHNTDYDTSVDPPLQANVNAVGRSICTSAAGLRFGFTMDNIDGTKNDVEYGFIYSQKAAEDLSIDTVDNKNIKKTIAHNRVDHGDTTSFNLVISNIPKKYLDREITARAYVCIDGMYYYSNVLKGSFSEVANLALADSEVDQATKDRIQNLLNREV